MSVLLSSVNYQSKEVPKMGDSAEVLPRSDWPVGVSVGVSVGGSLHCQL